MSDDKKFIIQDDELVKQAKAGNEQSAELLIKRYYASILRYCRWHCPNPETAEDLTQETFIRLFRHLDGYKGRGKFKAYLYTIANHLCIDESRKTHFLPLENYGECSDPKNTNTDNNPLHQVEEKEEIAYLLNFLSPEQKEAVILRFSEELSFSEIAKITGCSLRTAQSRVRNGLKIMRKENEHAQ